MDKLNIPGEISSSPLYSKDLAPVPFSARTWGTWQLAALWVGMAVCIPTYMLASYMIKSGLNWYEALIIIGVANLIITVPMVLNGHAGVKYGIPFPVIGRSAFGHYGVHIASILRGIVACGWFGVQTWIGGLAIDSIYHAITGTEASGGLSVSQFISFAIFWLINIYFVWKGTESIKWLEEYSAPILIVMGILLIIWGTYNAGGFSSVLNHSKELSKTSAMLEDQNGELYLRVDPVDDGSGHHAKAIEYKVENNSGKGSNLVEWIPATNPPISLEGYATVQEAKDGHTVFEVQFRKMIDDEYVYSSKIKAQFIDASAGGYSAKIWQYILWFTAMVGFWATMSISIADITRFAKSQKAQLAGQFIGLPGTMMLYSFVGIFVTCAAVINFKDILIADDAPWDPVSLLARFSSPVVVVISQIFMLIATLSTNIAANVIAPAYAISNLFPKKISFRVGGVITGIIGIVICPWWLLNEISNILIFISGLLGPVLGILICDYFVVRKKQLNLADLYKTDGIYSYKKTGFNAAALIAMFVGMAVALAGFWISELEFLYILSWFTGFITAFSLYLFIMLTRPKKPITS